MSSKTHTPTHIHWDSICKTLPCTITFLISIYQHLLEGVWLQNFEFICIKMVLVWAIFSIHLSICMNGLIVPSLKYNKFMYYFLVVLIWRHTIGYAFMYEPVCVDVALTHRFFSISFFQRNIYKKNTQLWLLMLTLR